MDPDTSPGMDPGAPQGGAPGMDRPALLAALRARIARLDRSSGGGPGSAESVPLCPGIDQHLPGGVGLPRAAVHEVLATDPGAAAGFCALLLARATRQGAAEGEPGGTVLWVAAEPDAWPPGLARFGLSPADLVLVQARRPVDALWAMEESLRCPGIAGALLALEATAELDMTAARRLQLAAEAGGALGLLLRAAQEGEAEQPPTTAALTRWRVAALPGAGGSAHDLGDPRWRLELLRARGGRPQRWSVTWREAAERLDLDTETEAEVAATPVRRRRAR
jgi:protein ImuA